MAQNKKQNSNSQGEQGTKHATPPSQQNSTKPPQKSTIDIASINASAADDSGEFVRGGKKNERKEGAVDQKGRTKSAAVKKSPEKSEEEKKEYAVPVLRTYQQDTKDMAQTKGGAELRTILAKEAEEKRQAQVEYRRKTKDIMKESVALRDKYTNFVQGRKKEDVKVSGQGVSGVRADTKDVDQENITRVLSGATAYMKSARDPATEQKKESSKQPDKGTGTAPQDVQPSSITPEESIDTTKSDRPRTEEKSVFARMRGRMSPKDVFTGEKREMLKQKQQEVVEKESIQDAWKDFKQKKKKLQQMGLEARDVRSYAATPDEQIPNSPFRKQNILLLAIVFFLLAGLISSVLFLALSPAEEPATDISSNTEDVVSVPDVIDSEKKVFVDTADAVALSDTWQSITEKNGEQNTVTKYVPYRSIEENELQISFQDFSNIFGVRFPAGLQNAFDNYYFVGKYLAQDEVSGVFIASVKKYGDAFVWMRNWEKDVINAFSTVFPNFFQQSKASSVTVESRIIDNQDVRVIRNPSSQKEMFYYFFGRSILVFIAGEESAIPLINARIRSTNIF